MAGGIPQNLLASMSVRLGMDTKAFDLGTRQAKGNLKGFQSSLIDINKLWRAAFGAASIAMVGKFAKSAIDNYQTQLEAETKLLTALKERSDITERLSRQATFLQGKTLFGDEQTLEAQSRLAMILGTNEIAIRKLIPLVQDLATAKNMDLSMAAELVAKSIGSSTNALSRYGIQITGAEGSAERLNSAISALTQQVGGQAEAIAGAGVNSWEQAKNAWGDASEVLGSILAPAVSQTGIAIKGMLEVMQTDKLTFWEKLAAMLSPYGIAQAEIKKNTEDLIEQFEDEKKARESQSEIIVKQIPLLDQLNDKIKEQTELWKSSISESELINRKKRLEQLQEEKKLLEELGTAKYFLDQQKKKDIEGLSPLKAISATGVTGKTTEEPGLKPTINTEFIDQYALSAEQLLAINEEIQNSFADLTSSMVEAFAQMAASGEGFQPGLLLLPIANVAENLGKLAISTGIATMGIKKALESLQGPVAIAAGIALVALAAAVKAKMSSMASGASVSTSLPSSYSGSTSGGDFNINRNYGERSQVIRLELDHKIEGDAIRLIGKRAELTHSMQS